jgi:hypothetical protein
MPPPGDPRGATPAPGQPAGEAAPAGPKVTIEVKEIKVPAPRFTGKGRYDITMDVSVTPAQDEGVWKISALDEKGKVVGSEERQLLLLREKPQTIVVNDLYCMTKPVAMKMEIALDKNGQPKVATAAGGGTGNQPGGAGQGGGGGSAPPSGSANPPPPGGGGAGDGRGGGGGGGAAPPPPPGDSGGGGGGGDEGGE